MDRKTAITFTMALLVTVMVQSVKYLAAIIFLMALTQGEADWISVGVVIVFHPLSKMALTRLDRLAHEVGLVKR